MWILSIFVPLAFYLQFSQAVKSSCMVKPVKLGDEATLSCHFETDISKPQHDVLVYLYKDNTEHLVVNYAWQDGQANIYTVQGYRIEGGISDDLVIKISNVSNSNAGRYSCLVALSNDGHESCTLEIIDVHSSERMTSFVVTEKAASQALAGGASQAQDIFTGERERPHAENTLHIAVVVLGAVFGVLVVIFLTILIIAIYKEWICTRCYTRDVNSDEESLDSNNKPTKYIYNAPSKDTKKIKTDIDQQQGLLA